MHKQSVSADAVGNCVCSERLRCAWLCFRFLVAESNCLDGTLILLRKCNCFCFHSSLRAGLQEELSFYFCLSPGSPTCGFSTSATCGFSTAAACGFSPSVTCGFSPSITCGLSPSVTCGLSLVLHYDFSPVCSYEFSSVSF